MLNVSPAGVTLIVNGQEVPFLIVPAAIASFSGIFWWFGYWEGILRRRARQQQLEDEERMDRYRMFDLRREDHSLECAYDFHGRCIKTGCACSCHDNPTK